MLLVLECSDRIAPSVKDGAGRLDDDVDLRQLANLETVGEYGQLAFLHRSTGVEQARGFPTWLADGPESLDCLPDVQIRQG